MTANPSLNVEIQGHTDNVGADAYNQTLSEARARSVMTWLTQDAVAAACMAMAKPNPSLITTPTKAG